MCQGNPLCVCTPPQGSFWLDTLREEILQEAKLQRTEKARHDLYERKKARAKDA